MPLKGEILKFEKLPALCQQGGTISVRCDMFCVTVSRIELFSNGSYFFNKFLNLFHSITYIFINNLGTSPAIRVAWVKS